MNPTGRKLLVFDASKCTACHYCEIACSYFHLKTVDLAKANLRVLHDPETGEREVAHCLHCDNALCLEACPTGAIYRDEETRIVKINPMKCVGCRSCMAACPLSVIWFHEEEACARKCDLCDGDPKCAKYCSPGAIKVVDRAEAVKILREGGK